MPKYMLLLHDDPAAFASVSLLADLGDRVGAAATYREALSRPCTEPERRFLVRRLRESEPG